MGSTSQQAGYKTILNHEEACIYMGVSKSYLYSKVADGSIISYKPSGKLQYFKKEDLDAFMLSNQF